MLRTGRIPRPVRLQKSIIAQLRPFRSYIGKDTKARGWFAVIQVTLRVRIRAGRERNWTRKQARTASLLPALSAEKNIAHYGPSQQSLARRDVTWLLVLFCRNFHRPGADRPRGSTALLSLSPRFVFFPYFVLTTLAVGAGSCETGSSDSYLHDRPPATGEFVLVHYGADVRDC